MDPLTAPEIEIEEDEGYNTDDVDELLEWIDEDVELEDEDEEEQYDEESTDFSDDDCLSPCVECGDPSVITVNNCSFCEICYEGIYQDYD